MNLSHLIGRKVYTYGQVTEIVNIEDTRIYINPPIVVDGKEYSRDYIERSEIIKVLDPIFYDKICSQFNCPHYIEWQTEGGNCTSCKLIGQSYHIEQYPSNCPHIEITQKYEQKFIEDQLFYTKIMNKIFHRKMIADKWSRFLQEGRFEHILLLHPTAIKRILSEGLVAINDPSEMRICGMKVIEAIHFKQDEVKILLEFHGE